MQPRNVSLRRTEAPLNGSHLKTVTYYSRTTLVRRQDLPEGGLEDFEEAAKLCDTKSEVMAVSHGWLQAGHADPIGARKKDVGELKRWSDCGLGKYVFWDFISLFQLPRTDFETVLFRDALRNMHLIYGNPTWMVVRLVGNPASAANRTPYTPPRD